GLLAGLGWLCASPPDMAKADTVNAGFTFDQTYNAVWGRVQPGDHVTILAAATGAYGAAQADGAGFFWTSLWQAEGLPAEWGSVDSLDIAVNGMSRATLSFGEISGYVDVLDNAVYGTIEGVPAGTPVTVTLGDFGFMAADKPRVVTTVDDYGDFTAAFAADLGPHQMAQVYYQPQAEQTVMAYLYPQDVFRVVNYNAVEGFAEPGSLVTVTVYDETPALVWEETVVAEAPHGTYHATGDGMGLQVGQQVQVELEFGGLLTPLEVGELTVAAQVGVVALLGSAPPDAPVRALVTDGYQNLFTSVGDSATPEGVYSLTLDFPLEPHQWLYVVYQDASGNEVGIATPPSQIRVVVGRPPEVGLIQAIADTPQRTVTYTLDTGSALYVNPARWCGNDNQCEGWNPWDSDGVAVEPGHVITAEFSHGPVMTMIVADVTLALDWAANGASGTVDVPGWLGLTVGQWHSEKYPVHGTVLTHADVSVGYSFLFPGFDVRYGMWARAEHYASVGGHRTMIQFDSTPHLEVFPLYNAVTGVSPWPNEALTATLAGPSGEPLAELHGLSNDARRFSLYDFPGYWILPYHRITVTGESGWDTAVHIPPLDVRVDLAANLVTGSGPQALLFIDHHFAHNGQDYAYGNFVPGAAYALDTGLYGADLAWQHDLGVTYQTSIGHLIHAPFAWPQIVAHYGPASGGDNRVWGHSAPPSRPLTLTVTAPGVGVLATRIVNAGVDGTYDVGNLPAGSIAAGNWVTVEFSNGILDSVQVAPVSATADAVEDLVVVAAPVGMPVHINADGPNGWWEWTTENDPVVVGASGVVTFDLGAEGYDIVPGTSFNVHVHQFHEHNTQYSFKLAAPELQLFKWSEDGFARPGGVFVYGFHYRNVGEMPAQDVQIVDTLPPGLHYAGDTSGYPVTLSSDASVVTWTVGALNPGEERWFMLTVNIPTDIVTGSGVISGNVAFIQTVTAGDTPDDNMAEAMPVDVWERLVDVSVYKEALVTTPAPGAIFQYRIDVCNQVQTAIGPVWLTETLPISTTLVDWYANAP
ncbi:MAG TPA: hypothetical protein PKH77_28615, partial [Anaerolineae bacterium]|nr:hypothetical protein [Anaerolineae bacterium]